MASVNKVILVGNLGADPELRYTTSGQAVCNFRIATNTRYTDKQDNSIRRYTEWHRIVAWGNLALICQNRLHVGSTVYIEGHLQTRKWTQSNGVKRYSTEIVARNMQHLDKYIPQESQTANKEICDAIEAEIDERPDKVDVN